MCIRDSHMMIYANRPHSYRDLPMRIGEIAHDFRYESSGTLKGIELSLIHILPAARVPLCRWAAASAGTWANCSI